MHKSSVLGLESTSFYRGVENFIHAILRHLFENLSAPDCLFHSVVYDVAQDIRDYVEGLHFWRDREQGL